MSLIQIKKTQTRTAISIDVKKEICEYMTVNPDINQANVALFFNTKYQKLAVDRTTISKIWKEREKWLSVLPNLQTAKIFHQRSVQFPELDKALQIWIS